MLPLGYPQIHPWGAPKYFFKGLRAGNSIRPRHYRLAPPSVIPETPYCLYWIIGDPGVNRTYIVASPHFIRGCAAPPWILDDLFIWQFKESRE